MEPSFLSLYSLLGCLEEFLQVLNRDDSKSMPSDCFLSWYYQTSLPEVRFVSTLHA
jgi:hypothetical protein